MLTSYQDIQPQQKLAAAKNANRLLPYWSDSAVAVANAYSWASSFNNSGTAPTIEALNWYLIAASRFPASPTLPADAGNLELQLGNWRAAQQDDLRALHLDPWTYLALEGLGTIAADEHDWHTSLFWYQRALIVAPSNNDLNRLIKADELHLQAG
jgi:tetratricopeptide (TPR) repeat protein